MNEATRRAWSRPELIVIVRGGPEEAVLTACKTLKTYAPVVPHNVDGNCNGLPASECSACSAQPLS
jgi:hypothetical protein